MSEHKKYGFSGKIVMVGCGSVGRGVLPLLPRHIDFSPTRLLVIDPEESTTALVSAWGGSHLREALTRENYPAILSSHLAEGDFLLNLSVDVSSIALMVLCQQLGVNYLDTCIEPWSGDYFNTKLTPAQRSNYALREQALALRRPRRDGPTMIIAHGANPGLVSHLAKEALLHLAAAQPGSTASSFTAPTDRQGWARLAQSQGVRTIHIAERDTQCASPRKKSREFINTWSVSAFIGEGMQPAELGWGTHEQHFPEDGRRHHDGCLAAVYLDRPGLSVRVRSWVPTTGAQHGFLVTHGEAISLADYLTLGLKDKPIYRPTVHYAYHPSDDTMLSIAELAGNGWQLPTSSRIAYEDIDSGYDELGVLLMGTHPRGTYWYGTRLDIHTARRLAPNNNATSLQVAISVVGATIWAMKNPRQDVVDPDDLPYDEILDFCRPYLGTVQGVYSSWTPLQNRNILFREDVDEKDPWQFKNFRVT